VKRDVAGAIYVSACWGCVVALGAYAAVRTVQFFAYPDPNPAALVWSAHAGFFWRCWTCAYAGAIAAFVVYVWVKVHPEGALRALPPAIAITAGLLALQTVFLP
jgi:hypothetical protein